MSERTTIVTTPPAALDRESAAAYLALSVTTFEKLVRDDDIPQPRQLAGRRVAWIRTELDTWLMARPKSKQLPPENTHAPKPRGPAANDPAIKTSKPQGVQKAA